MGYLSKFALAQVQKPTHSDPRILRRNRVLDGLQQQIKVLAAALDGKEYEVPIKRWRTKETGEREQFNSMKRIKPWFFELNGKWFVQCKAGTRVLMLDKANNAVQCKDLADVGKVLEGLAAAVEAGELDDAIQVASQRKPRQHHS